MNEYQENITISGIAKVWLHIVLSYTSWFW